MKQAIGGDIMKREMKSKLLKPREVAERLSVSHATVVRWIKRGDLHGIKVGRVWRVSEDSLKEYLESRTL